MSPAALEPLCAETVADGQALAQLNEAIEQLKKHVITNPRRKGQRIATLTIEIEPSIDPETKLNFPNVSYSVTTKYPKIKGVGRQAQIDNRGVVVATTGAKPIQTHIPEAPEEAKSE